MGSCSLLTCLELEAPALKAVQNERVVFSSAFGIEQSPFEGKPNERNNRLWADLYDCKAFEAYVKITVKIQLQSLESLQRKPNPWTTRHFQSQTAKVDMSFN